MFPTQAEINARRQRVAYARLNTRAAQQNFRQSLRRAAVSPRGLLLAFALGVGAGRRLRRPPAQRGGKVLNVKTLTALLPLLKLV